MKYSPYVIILLAALVLIVPLSPAMAEDEATQECAAPVLPARVSIVAQEVSGSDSVVIAKGNVVLRTGRRIIRASEGTYNLLTGEGSLKDASFTNMSTEPPGVSHRSKRAKAVSGDRVRARDVSLFLGRWKVLSLPSMVFRLGATPATTAIFPRLGFSNTDGVTLAQSLRLVDNQRTIANADVRLTSKSGVQGNFTDQYGINGNLGGLPGRFATYESVVASSLSMPVQDPSEPVCVPAQVFPSDITHLRQFGTLSFRQQVYDVKNPNLIVYKEPELGLHYLGNPLNFTGSKLDPRLAIYPEVIASWGLFKEIPGLVSSTDREYLSLVAPLNVFPTGQFTSIQPIISYSVSQYSGGDSYRVASYAMDAAHLFPNGSIVIARYIQRNATGVTPLEFDSIDYAKEIQAGFQMRLGRNILGFVSGWDAEAGIIYDWELMYGHRSDCIAWWVRWDQRFQRLSFDVSLINV